MKNTQIAILLTLSFPAFILAQVTTEFDSKVKIHQMELDNTSDSVVVRQSDGSLAVRQASSLMEHQVLTISNDTVFLTDGGFVVLPVDQVNDADSNPQNEIQQFRVSEIGDTLFLSESNWVIVPNISVSQPETVSDIDGNEYSVVTIGTQKWFRENLKVTRYNDGTPITHAVSEMEWQVDSPAWCWYNNDSSNDTTYGKIYNWYVGDSLSNGNKNVCPSGWHIPSQSEWDVLINELGGTSVAGGKLKEVGFINWVHPNTGATNSSNFTALPGGYRRHNDAVFDDFTEVGAWHSNNNDAWYLVLRFDQESIFTFVTLNRKRSGHSLRCLKDTP